MAKKNDFITIPENDVEYRNGVVVMSLKTYQKLLNQTMPGVSVKEQRDIEKRYCKPSRKPVRSYNVSV